MGLVLWMSYLGSMLEYPDKQTSQNVGYPDGEVLNKVLDKVASHRWFTRHHADFALSALCNAAEIDGIDSSSSGNDNGKTLGFWMRPLSPFDGLDLILLSLNAGCRCLIRTVEPEAFQYKGIIELLEARFPYLKDKVEFTERPLRAVDAYIITGETPTIAQLEYFAKKPVFTDTFSQYPGTAVLSGEETQAELDALAIDLCMFFGRSKYSISKIVVPVGYDFSALLKSLESYRENVNHSRYFNHYEYRKAACIVSGESVIDNGFLILKKETNESRHIGIVEYAEYPANGLPELILKDSQVFRARPNNLERELAFGSACKRNFSLAGEFLQFLEGV